MTGRSKRALIGCGIGCAGLIVIGVAFGIGFGAWVSRKGAPLEPRRLLGPDTTGYVEWTLHLDDPGTEGFVRALIDALEAERAGQTEGLPPWLIRWIGERQTRELEHDIRELFPVVGAWTLASGSGMSEDETLYSLSPTGLGNRLALVDWMMPFASRWTDDLVLHEHGDEKIFRVPAGSGRTLTFFIRENAFFLSSDLDAARVGTDRLSAVGSGSRAATDIDRLFDRTPPASTLRGAVSNGRGELPRLWRQISGRDDDERLAPVRGLTLEGGLRADGSLTGVARVVGPTAEWATSNAESLADLVSSGLDWTGVDLQVSAVAEGESVRIDLRAVGLVELIGDLAGEQGRSSNIRIEF